jgi:HPt (histidine-containing phosphotransfer) domain-containing protein/ActR/RegA family two-component response regulator
VDCLRTRATSFDVVLMDAHMPVMDGFGATEVIRRELGITSLPIIALTADARATERQRALAAGMNDFLAKPFDPKDLIRSIQRLITPSATSAQASANGPNRAGEWPQLEGIETDTVRTLLAGDLELFLGLLQRLLEEYTDVSPPGSLDDAAVRATYGATMHKLKGAAGQLGARGISALAGRIEADCARNQTGGTRQLASTLDVHLAQLRASVQALFAPEPVTRLERAATSVLPAPPQLAQIVYLLREQNLAVLEQVQALYPWARATWGTARCQTFVSHVQSLRFAEAAEMLDPHLRSSA